MPVVTADASEGASIEITGPAVGEVAVLEVRSPPPPKMDRRSCGGPKADESKLGHIARPSQRHESDRGHRCRWWLELIHQLNRARS